jgi:hypothetical protein
MTPKKPKLLGTAYINLIEVDGETKFEYGYDLDKVQVSLSDIALFLSFLDILQDKAQQDFKDRLDVQEKEYNIERRSD